MKYILLLLILIVNVSCLAKNDEQIISRFEIQIGENYQADQQLGRTLIKTVLESQKAWVSYRDKHCKIIEFVIEEDTAAYITTINSCTIEMNEERMEQLSQLL
tara:strand:- start:310 stop:618 length:309 start_codon:yes stop_codon:yes gene_type:complete